ncbi:MULTISPECIES: hypothetical protein [unclassified Caulobacter]|uniref:hypothetical protein n=1 Tax=unclassified Caulobacter TaxID=2648921 RepID=UPI0011B4CC23|nr:MULTISPECIES: hypothetical protein [unclassified Caulobacter]
MRIALIFVLVSLAAGCAGAPVVPSLRLDDGSHIKDDATPADRGSERSDAGLTPSSEDVPRLYAEFIARQRCPDDALCGAEPARTVAGIECSRARQQLGPQARCTFRLRMTRPGFGYSMSSDFYCIGLFTKYPEGWRMDGFAALCEAIPDPPLSGG